MYGRSTAGNSQDPYLVVSLGNAPFPQLPLTLHSRLVTEGIPCPRVARIAASVFWTGASCKWALAVLLLIQYPLACTGIWAFV